jgi:hypothetical protein
MLQLYFICGPDPAFHPTGAVSHVNWRKRFSQYKCTILRFPNERRAELLAWYDDQVFRGDTTPATPTHEEEKIQTSEMDDVIHQLSKTNVEHIPASPPFSPSLDVSPTLPSQPPAMVPPSGPLSEPDSGPDNQLSSTTEPIASTPDQMALPKSKAHRVTTKKSKKTPTSGLLEVNPEPSARRVSVRKSKAT